MPPDVVLPWRDGGAAKPKKNPVQAAIAPKRQAQVAAAGRPVLPTTAGAGVQLPWRKTTNENTEKAQKELSKPRSNIGQLAHIIESTPVGLGHFAVTGARDLVESPVREVASGVGLDVNRRRPRLPGEFARSFQRTGERITHPGRYVEAFRQGELPGVLLEDVANASVVASLAAAPLRAASARAAAGETAAREAERATLAEVIGGRATPADLAAASQRANVAATAARRLAPVGRAGQAIETTAHLGATGANAPILPLQYGARLARDLGARIAEAPLPARLVAEGVETVGQRLGASRFGEAAADLRNFATERRYAKQLIAEQSRLPRREATHDVEAVAHRASKGLSTAEDQAATAVAFGLVGAPETRALIRGAGRYVGDEALSRMVDNVNKLAKEKGVAQGHTYTPEAVQLAMDFADGLLDPEVTARIARGVEGRQLVSKRLAPIQARGRLTEMDPEQLGTELLTAETTAHPSVLAREQSIAQREAEIAPARKRAEAAAEVAARREAEVESRGATTTERIEKIGGQRHLDLEDARRRFAALADRQWARADEARLRGDVRAARAAEEAALKAGRLEQQAADRLVKLRQEPGKHLTQAEEMGAGAARQRAAAQQSLQVGLETVRSPAPVVEPAPAGGSLVVRGKQKDMAQLALDGLDERALEDLGLPGDAEVGSITGNQLDVAHPDALAWKVRGAIDILKDNLDDPPSSSTAAERKEWRAELKANEALLAQLEGLPRQPTVGPPTPPIRARVQSETRSNRLIAQGERQEAAAARLEGKQARSIGEAAAATERLVEGTQAYEGAVRRAEGVREAGETRATEIATAANDAAEILGTKAKAAEAKGVELAAKTPLRDVAEREAGRLVRTAEQKGKADQRYGAATRELDKRIAARDKAQADYAKELEKRRQSLNAVPARYRYTVSAARNAIAMGNDLVRELRLQGADVAADSIQQLVDEAPATLADVVAAGVDPVYLPGGLDPYAGGARSRAQGLVLEPGEHSLRTRKLRSEEARQTTLHPTTMAGHAAIAIREIDRAIQNSTARALIAQRGVRPEDVVGELTPDLLANGGKNLLEAMRAQGLEPIDPSQLFSTPSTVGPDTAFIPRALKREVGVYYAPESTYEVVMKTAFDPLRRAWKHAVLPLSGSWHVGNIISNMVMNTVGTGSLEWVGQVPAAWKAVRAEGHGVAGVPARLFGLSAEQELRNFIRRSTGREPRAVMKLLDKSYALNTFVDDLSRTSVFLAERNRGVRSGLGADAAEQEALRTALKVSGDFTNLTEFERGVVRRAIPFYTWIRHVTQLVGHLAIENPIRLVWTLHLADMLAPDLEGPFGDSIPVDGGLWSVANLSPLGSFANVYMNPRGVGAGLLQTLGPELDIGAAAGFGVNLGRGAQPLRLPPGHGRLDDFGNPTNTPLIGRPRDLLAYSVRQVPLVNTVRQGIEGQKLAEYDTGQPILKGRKLIDSTPGILGTGIGGRPAILARQLGIPTVTPFDVEGMTEQANARRQSAARARERYAKDLAKAKQRQ